MCGRDSFTATWAEVRAFSQPLSVATPATDPLPNYNRAPTQEGWTIVQAEAGGIALPMRWGLLPAWASDTRLAYKTINARLESVAEKPAFRGAWQRRRCHAPRNAGFSATDSSRALMVLYASRVSLAHAGSRPQRIGNAIPPASTCTIAQPFWVGARL